MSDHTTHRILPGIPVRRTDRFPRAWRRTAVLVCGVLLLAACGDGDDSASDTPEAAGSEATRDASTGDDAGAGDGSDESSSADPATGGDESPTIEVPDVEPCDLVSIEEVNRITGTEVAVPEPSMIDYGPYVTLDCRSDDIHLTVDVYADEETATEGYEMLVDTESNDYPSVAGVGDEAHDVSPLGDLQARSGRYVVAVSTFVDVDRDNSRGEAELAAATEMANQIIDQLP